MRTISFLTVMLFGIFSASFAQTTVQSDTIKVWGNCGMCKKKIENAAKAAGAKTASWDEETQVLKVSYVPDKTSNTKIQEAIAKVGYDTRDFAGDNKAYGKLPACCHYERKGSTDSTTTDTNH